MSHPFASSVPALRRLVPRLLPSAFAGLLLCAPAGGAQVDGSAPIDLSLKSAPLTAVLESFARIGGVDLVVDGGVDGQVTIELESVPWEDALDRVCRMHRVVCELRISEPPAGDASRLRVRAFDPDRPDLRPGLLELLDLSLAEAPLAVTLGLFGKLSGVEVEVAPDLQGRPVTLELKAMPWSVVLGEICRTSGCRVDWSAVPIRIEAADPVGRIDLDLDPLPFDRALSPFAALPILGAPGRVALDVEPAVGDRPVSLTLLDASWAEALSAACRQATCRWSLHWDDVPVLRVRQALQDPAATASAWPRPEPGTLAPRMTVRAELDGRPVVETAVRFTWDAPVAWIPLREPDAEEAADRYVVLAWVPLEPGLAPLVVLDVDCSTGQRRHLATWAEGGVGESVAGGDLRVEVGPAAGGVRPETAGCPTSGAETGARLRVDGATAPVHLSPTTGSWTLVRTSGPEPSTVGVLTVDPDRVLLLRGTADGIESEVRPVVRGTVDLRAGAAPSC